VTRLAPILLLLALTAGCNRAREESKAKPADPKPVAAGPKDARPAQPAAPPKPVDPRRPAGSVIPGWGTLIDPSGDCTFEEKNGDVTITVPPGVHDINPTKDGRNAPRVLRTVDGDFRAVVRVRGEFRPAPPAVSPQSAPFHGAGLLLFADETNLLALARNRWVRTDQDEEGWCFAPLFELFENGRLLTGKPGIQGTAFQGDTTALYLERKGDHLRGAYSHDSKTWEGWRETTTQLPRRLQIGVVAINTASNPLAVTFDGFKLLDE